jgi:uncharacterized protein
MNHIPRRPSFDDFDELNNPRPEETDFARIAERALSRRSFLGGTVAVGATALVMGTTALTPFNALAAGRLGFEAVAANGLDTVTVPLGYRWQVVARWGDPLWSSSTPFDQESRGTGASQQLAFGDNCDGMELFVRHGRMVLAVNNEYTNLNLMYGNREGAVPRNADDVVKGKAAHGVSVCEVARQGDRWAVVVDSPYNRRITADTPMEITGPARGHDWLKTAADPSGTGALGTMNNCGSGLTPWGTFLTCEENFNGYFSASDEKQDITDAWKRYGIGPKDWGYAWATADERFDITKHPNEPNRVGYVVEIDPFDPTSTPKKRTALGRFKHENIEVVVAADGRIVAYSGDDERGEFLYRFVSDGRYVEGGDNADLLERGTLYVAKFNDDGSGQWLELNPQTTGMASQAEVCIHTRMAASTVGATTMDRPEWIAANPRKAEAYCCLTNNSRRAADGKNAGGDPMVPGGPNPRAKNDYGQIVRWVPAGGDHAADAFAWDLFVVAGNPAVHTDANAGSRNVNADNMFNSPDGLMFDSNGLLWIQTDGNYSNEKDFAGQGNNQMLVGDPATGEIRRFMVGPKECEITGITWSPDRTTVFVGIQHPGERGNSHFPDGGNTVPRSAVVAITRDDGRRIG